MESAGIADGESEEVLINRIKDSEASIETSEGKNEDSVTIPENENSDFRNLKKPEEEDVTEPKIEIESTGQNSKNTESNESTSCLECLKMKEMLEELEKSLEKIRIEELTYEKQEIKKMKETMRAELEKVMDNRMHSIETKILKEIEWMRVEIEEKSALLETIMKDLEEDREQMQRNNAKLLKRKEKEIETLIKLVREWIFDTWFHNFRLTETQRIQEKRKES